MMRYGGVEVSGFDFEEQVPRLIMGFTQPLFKGYQRLGHDADLVACLTFPFVVVFVVVVCTASVLAVVLSFIVVLCVLCFAGMCFEFV
jgi:hypothetical protein